MPRKPRLHFTGALYHVIGRGNNRQKVFLSYKDYVTFLLILLKLKKRKPFFLYAYCLMPNHYHFLLEVADISLSVLMQRLLTTYALFFNRTQRRHGHLFQERFRAILCEKDSYLLELVRYIHLNPVRSHLVKSPSEWKWSGHNAYLGHVHDPLVNIQATLSNFGTSPSAARQNYAKFVRDGMFMGHRTDFYPEEKLPYLGEDKFIKDLSIQHEEKLRKLTPEVCTFKAPLSAILEGAIREKGLPGPLIKSSSRLEAVTEARHFFMRAALAHGHKVSDIARFLGCAPSTLSKFLVGLEGLSNEAIQA